MDKAFTDLAAQLHELGGDVMRKAQRKGLKAVGELYRKAIVAAAPEKTDNAGGLLKPGELKASIKARVRIASDADIADGKTSRVVIGPVGRTEKIVANWVENGHALRPPSSTNPRRNRRHALDRVPAHPFVRPTADALQSEGETVYTAAVMDDLQKAMK